MAVATLHKDRVVETATTTGTGAFTLAGALVGFQRFADAVAVSDYVHYLIEAIDAGGDANGGWEVGVGCYSAADTLTRTTVLQSSNADAAVNFAAGTKRVSLVSAAASLTNDGALVRKAADPAAADYTVAAAIAWDSEDYDTNAYHDTVTNNSRLTVGISCPSARLSAQVTLSAHTANKFVKVEIRKNGSAVFNGYASQIIQANTTTPTVQVSTPPITVAVGDYFEVFLTVETDALVVVTATQSWFHIERIM